MRNFGIIGFFTLLVLLAFSGCKKSEETTIDFGFEYYDLTPGRFIIYDVVEISHSQGASGSDTSIYQLKTVIGDTVQDNEGRTARKYLRYKRLNPGDSWSLEDVWTTIIHDYKAELVEENVRSVKMVFAPTTEKIWNANSYNTLPELECTYDAIGETYSVGNQNFESSIIVEQADELNLIEYKRKYEVYAKGIGMIKKHYQDLNINNFDVSNISEGKELFMNFVSFGVE